MRRVNILDAVRRLLTAVTIFVLCQCPSLLYLNFKSMEGTVATVTSIDLRKGMVTADSEYGEMRIHTDGKQVSKDCLDYKKLLTMGVGDKITIKGDDATALNLLTSADFYFVLLASIAIIGSCLWMMVGLARLL